MARRKPVQVNLKELPKPPKPEKPTPDWVCVQLTPEQISAYWDGLKQAAFMALPVEYHTPMTANLMLTDLLSGAMQMWALIDAKNKQLIPSAIGVTVVSIDNYAGLKKLNIPVAFAYNPVNNDGWMCALERIKEFAKQKGCISIVTTSMNDRVKQLSEILKASSVCTHIEWKV